MFGFGNIITATITIAEQHRRANGQEQDQIAVKTLAERKELIFDSVLMRVFARVHIVLIRVRENLHADIF